MTHRSPEAPITLLARIAAVKREAAVMPPLVAGTHGMALRLVTEADVHDAALIARLGGWRAAHMAHYPTQFRVTDEGTAAWLRDLVVGDPDRMMFVIVEAAAPQGPIYGHMGIDHADEAANIIYLSNVVNGDRARLPRGAVPALERRMLDWVFDTLGVLEIRATPFEDNIGARRMLDNVGFRPVGRIGLRRRADGDRIEYRPREPGDEAPPDRWWEVVVLPRPSR
jgi:RimJ/RimL family protein N-acetyltransferase